MRYPLLVISLKRTPERLETFFSINQQSLSDWDVEVVYGIDGVEQDELMHRSKWITEDVAKTWTRGAIGSALSHIKAWRRCIESNQVNLIVEDDAVLSVNLKSKLKELNILGTNAEDQSLFLLGWNMDSLLQAEISQGLEMISLFEPVYPDLKEIRKIINSRASRRVCNLKRCFGLPAYLVSPNVAQQLSKMCKPLQAEKNGMTRGIPEHYLTTLDGMLTNRYEKIKAQIIVPPLSLATNNQQTSLTRLKDIQNYRSR